MKAKDLYFIVGLSTLFLVSAAFAINRVANIGPVITETRQLPNYEKINVEAASRVSLYQSQQYKVVIEAQENIIDHIITVVEDNELIIKVDPGTQDRELKQRGFTVSIYSPVITGLKVLGSADIKNETPISSDNLNIQIKGSGNIQLSPLHANRVDAKLSGSGNLTITGSCDEQDLTIMGSGFIHNYDLVCNSSNVIVNGSGSANVMCIDYLNAKIIGSGDIFYKGDPITECSIAGSGKLHSI